MLHNLAGRTLTVLLISAAIIMLCAVLLLLYCTRFPGNPRPDGPVTPVAGQQETAAVLGGHVRVLTEEIGERHYENRRALEQAADYIERQFVEAGFTPRIEQIGKEQYRNIVVEIEPRSGSRAVDSGGGEIIVVGAHYDTVWLTPGADDNASGIAVLLELARHLRETPLARRVRLAAFVNEEAPMYGSELMGSLHQARISRERQERIIGMFSLEMVGYYSDAPGSQGYPAVLRYLYPDRGDFITFVADMDSRRFMAAAIEAFRVGSQLPSEGMAAPVRVVPDITRSDNASFWAYGYPAVMITDTSNYRNPNYHTVSDLYHTLDYDRMALLVFALTGMIVSLAND